MKRNLFLRLCLMMVVVLSLYSCRNEDFANQEATSQRNAADFFKHSKNGGLNAKSGVITLLSLKLTTKNTIS